MTTPTAAPPARVSPGLHCALAPSLTSRSRKFAKAAHALGNDIEIVVRADGRIEISGAHGRRAGWAWHLQADVDPDSEGTPKPSAALKRGPK